MKLKNENGNQKINLIMKDTSAIATNERKIIFNESLEDIKKTACNESGKYDEKKLKEQFKKVAEFVDETTKKLIIETWSKKDLSKNKDLLLHEKAHFLAEIISQKARIPSTTFIMNVAKFVNILKTEAALNSFLAQPQDYINSHNKTLSAHDLQILQFMINDPKFNALPSINQKPPVFVYTPLTTSMYQLNIWDMQKNTPNYGTMDATRFEHCINSDVKDKVLDKAKIKYTGQQVMGGMGALPDYSRKGIKNTANVVKTMKQGVCHTFAQFALDQLLTLIDNKQLPPLHIKMVSHQQGLGSHTFLLIGHDSDNLKDLSNCLIVDPWALAIGYANTYGVFTETNYPFLGMATNLVCCYDNQAPVQSLNQELGTAVAKKGLFAHKEEKLPPKQDAAVKFLKQLTEFTPHALKKELLGQLIASVESGDLKPEKAAKLGTLAVYAKSIEKNGDKYSWKKNLMPVDDAILSAFNDKNNKFIIKLWDIYASKNNLKTTEGALTAVDSAMVSQIVNSLNEGEDHEFDNAPTTAHKI